MAVQTPYFQKYQKHVTIPIMMCYQMLILPLGLFSLYGIFTLNLYIVVPLILISIIQFPAKKSELFISFVQKYIMPAHYFKKFSRIRQQDIEQKEKTLFGYHPHSIFSYTILLNMNRTADGIPDFTACGSRFGFNAPILGFILRLWGCCAVDPENLKLLMKQGRNIGIVPGGYEQGALTSPEQMRLWLSNRKGFVKYALRYGYTLRPTISFGENKAFQTFDYLSSVKVFLSKYKVPIALFFSKKYLFFIDPNLQITTVIGKGIRNENYKDGYEPTCQQVEQYHRKYVEQTIRLYEKYKHLNDGKPLIIL